MDPEFYRNSLQGRYAPQDINSLISEQAGLSSGLTLGTSFPGVSQLASAAARQFGPLPGYTGHALHSNLSESHLQNLAAQNAYKSLQVSQASFSDPYAGLRLTSQAGGSTGTKPIFTQDTGFQKEISSYASMIPQGSGLELPQKSWGLSNFMAPNANPYGPPTDLSSVDYTLSHVMSSQPQLNPPPAHSSKPTTTNLRHHPYPATDMFQSRSTKSPPAQSIYSHPATPVSSQPAMFSYSQPLYYSSKSDLNAYSKSDLNAYSKSDLNAYSKSDLNAYSKSDMNAYSKSDMNAYSSADSIPYEAVSPAAPDHHNSRHESYVSLEDLASISSTRQKLEVGHQHVQKTSPVSLDRTKTPVQQKQKPLTQDMYNGQNTQISQIKQSPQPSPMSAMGGSPQMHMGSPQASMPSSTVVPAPPPVQAPADSTTKPKKSRSRKKKEPVMEIKTENSRQTFTPHSFSSSPDLSQQRVSVNDYMNNQQAFMQNSRNQQQVYTSTSLTETGHSNSPLMASSLNQSCMKGQNQVNFQPKSEPQQCAVPHSNPSAQSQQPQIMGFQTPASTSQSSLVYSVSDALEMSREAVFNQGLLEGYGGSEMSTFGMQESFSSQLGMDNMRRHEMYNGQEDGVYVNNPYGGQFVSPNSVLNMDMGNSQDSNQQSTIDEAAFSSLMGGGSFSQDPSDKYKNGQSDKMPYMPLTVKLEAEEDEDLSHLAQVPADNTTDTKQHNKFFTKPHVDAPAPVPPANPKPTVQNASGGTSFIDSFMSFLQGKKPETLSSMSSAIIHNKPQLPKYIPEPRRPRPVDNTNSARGDRADGRSGNMTNITARVSQNSVISFSDQDDEGDYGEHRSAVQHAMTSLGENEKVKFSTNKAGGLTMKINLTQLKREEDARNRLKSKKPSKKKRDKLKQFGLKVPGQQGESSGEDTLEKDHLPSRQQSTRKAKEAVKKENFSSASGKYHESDDTDSDTLKPISSKAAGNESDEVYDSDNDPVWTPFALEKKVAPGFEGIEAAAASRKRSRPRVKSKSKESRPRNPGTYLPLQRQGEPGSYVPPQKTPRVGEPAVLEVDSESEEEEQIEGVPPITEELQVGAFVMEKKDLKNTESYAIWKIENGRMLHKFELFSDHSKILHRAIPTFSSWLPSMKNGFVHVRVRHVFKQGDKELVEVEEQCRPKPSIDRKLEEKYEEHPLVDAFNVYLQIFLSQALEPGFLSAIRESNERFYLDALDKIDNAINLQLSDIDSKVHWKIKFKDAVKCRPHIRELDRPNLKQSCQACEFASQPAIKSVHLFGNPYDRFSLKEMSAEGLSGSQEFMIGKTAAKYVKPYHNLFHFKYNLYKRCGAKVNIVQDTNVNDNAAILDQCLQNRAWVLQIFEDLKKLLEKG